MSFGWSGLFREGQWREFRRFILEQRRDIGVRVVTIETELSRIGDVLTIFDRDAQGVPTEDRLGILVTPPGSTLDKLMTAYVVQGGNPLDISLFLKPGQSVARQDGIQSPYPYGGVLSPQQDDHSPHRKSKAGMLPCRQYLPGRLPDGRDSLSYVTTTTADYVQLIRRGFNQEIRQRRTALEERILQQCDLREQLERELYQLLMQACGGTLHALPRLGQEFTPSNLITHLIASIDRLVWESTDGRVDLMTNSEAGSENPQIVPDLPGEEWSAL